MEIVFIRHGSTDWNKDRRFQGQSDIPLNSEGRAQARALARVLHDIEFDRVVSSDLSRAYETAQIICGSSKVQRDPRWREFAFGLWEGLTWEEIASRWPIAAEHGHTAAKLYAPAGGETFAAVCERVKKALADLQCSSDGRILVVTHAGPMHAMLHVLFADQEAAMSEIAGIRFLPASITRVQLANGTGQIVSLNDVSHLL